MIDNKDLFAELEHLTKQREEHVKMREEEINTVVQIDGAIKLVRHLLVKSQANKEAATAAAVAAETNNGTGATGSV